MSVFYTSATYEKKRKDGGSSPKYYYELTADLQSQSVVNNTSTVLFTLYMYASTTGSLMWDTNVDSYAARSSITIAGTTYNSSSNVDRGSNGSGLYIVNGGIREYTTSKTNKLEICKQTVTITHSNDGTKYVAVSFDWIAGPNSQTNVYYPKSFSSNGATIELPAIPRSSTISCASSITVNNESSSFSYTITSYANYWHTLSYTLDETTTTVWTSHQLNTTSTTLTISNSTLLSKVTTGLSKPLVFTLKTYTNSSLTTQVGNTVTQSVTVNINAAVFFPTVSLSSITVNTSVISGYLVAGYSTAKVTYSATKPTGTTGATISFSSNKGSMATASTTSLSGNVATNTLPASTTNYVFIVSAGIVDSRGASSARVALQSGTVYGYSPPVITAKAIRAILVGDTVVEDGASETVYIAYSAAVGASINGQNTIQSVGCTYGTTSYTSGSWVSLPADSSGTFVFTATDKISSSTTTIVVPMARYPLDLYTDETAQHMGVGLAGAKAIDDAVTSAENIYISKSSDWVGVKATRSDTNVGVYLETGSGGANHGVYSDGYFRNGTFYDSPKWMVYRDNTGKVILNGTADGLNISANNPDGSTTVYPVFVESDGRVSLYENDGLTYYTKEGTASALGFGGLKLGNTTNSGTAGNKWGFLDIYPQTGAYYMRIRPVATLTENRTVYLPNIGGNLEVCTVIDSTSRVQGGSSLDKDYSPYSYLKIWVHAYDICFSFELDLRKKPSHKVSGGTATNDVYRGAGHAPLYTTGASSVRIENYYCVCEVNSAKSSLTVLQIGYYYSSGTRADRNSNAEYYVYRVEGFV